MLQVSKQRVGPQHLDLYIHASVWFYNLLQYTLVEATPYGTGNKFCFAPSLRKALDTEWCGLLEIAAQFGPHHAAVRHRQCYVQNSNESRPVSTAFFG
jgi:hypothetical protein